MMDDPKSQTAEMIALSQEAVRSKDTINHYDDGCGFAPSVLDRAFDRFIRGEATPRGGRRGAGLGLAIVRLIVEAHGGRVEARNGDSHGARGASVVISLRACAAPVDPPQPWERRVEEGDACASLSP